MSLSALNHTLRTKDADEVLEIAGRLRFVPLCHAARIVALLAEQNHPRYRPCADRFLIRVIQEVRPEPVQTKRLADVLAHVHHYYWRHEAMIGLHDVVGQLHRRDVRLNIGFDSEGRRRAWR